MTTPQNDGADAPDPADTPDTPHAEPATVPASSGPAASTEVAIREGELDGLTTSSGLLRPSQVAHLKALIEQWVDSGQVPKQYKPNDSWQKDPRYMVTRTGAMLRVYYAVQSLASVRANVLTYLRFVAYVEGQSMFFGDLPLALARRDKLIAEPPDEFWLDKDYTPITRANKNSDALPFMAVSRIRVAGSDMGWREREYTLASARDANKYHRDNDGNLLLPEGSSQAQKWLTSVWAVHTRRMLQMRARSWVIKDTVPDCLNGVPVVEYDADEVPAEIMPTRMVPASARAPSRRLTTEQLTAKYQQPGGTE